MNPPLQVGCHVSTAGGIYKSPERGEAIGAACMQVFTRNQMSWKHKPLTDDEVSRFKAERVVRGMGVVMSHDSYLINLASPDPEKLQKSLDGFDAEVARCTRLGIELLNFHPGAHMKTGVDAGTHAISRSLNTVAAAHPHSKVRLVLETVAGQGTTIGRSFEEMARIIAGLEQPERYGICVDTAHIFAAGYDIGTDDGWERTWEAFDRHLGMDRLVAFHVNDSKVPLGSNVDRHALIGRGHIGPAAFVRLMTDARTRHIPKFLETPAGNEGYTAEIGWLNAVGAGESPPLADIEEVKRGY